MREVSIKEFQKNIYAQIKELPCLVTKNGNPYFQVATLDEVATHTVATPFKVDKVSPEEAQKIVNKLKKGRKTVWETRKKTK